MITPLSADSDRSIAVSSNIRGFWPSIAFCRFASALALYLALCCPFTLHAAQQWTQPTAEELAMTSQKEVPGAAAVYLYREENADDFLHKRSVYVRLKVLTEEGKKYGHVAIDYSDFFHTGYGEWFGTDITQIDGRTIHADGTVIPFSGKAETQNVRGGDGYLVRRKTFTLPEAQVGSILEYRYVIDIQQNLEHSDWFEPPYWNIQKDLFLRKGYFRWKATGKRLLDPYSGSLTDGIAWASVLPPGVELKNTYIPPLEPEPWYRIFEVHVDNVAPQPHDNFMPPVSSFVYRVNFYYAFSSSYYSTGENSEAFYWKTEGAFWAKQRERFIGSKSSILPAEKTLVSDGDSDAVKLRKIYSAMMSLDNSSYLRNGTSVDGAAPEEPKSIQDIWSRKKGNNDQITLLFVGLARAAGFKAYIMRVTNRDRRLFSPAWRTLGQLDDEVAIVVVDGREQFFDPGARYCPFGQLAWIHTGVEGLRELPDGSTAIARTPQASYTDSQTQRTGDLVLQADGTVHGTLQITWLGSRALEWRQKALRQDETEVKRAIKEWLENRIPIGMQAELPTLDNLIDYEKPLIAHFTVQGPVGTVTGRGRLSLPSAFFEAQARPLFAEEKREVPIDFHFGERVLDGVRIQLPPDEIVEFTPKEAQLTMRDEAGYRSRVDVQGSVLVLRRKYDLTMPYFLPKEYDDLRSFYSSIATTDQQQILLRKPQASGN